MRCRWWHILTLSGPLYTPVYKRKGALLSAPNTAISDFYKCQLSDLVLGQLETLSTRVLCSPDFD